jgi:hypothetical protein
VAASLGNDGDNTAIEGYTFPITGTKGSIPIAADTLIGSCSGVQSFYLALFVPLDGNDNSAPLGYSLDPKYRPPPLLYDCDAKCFSGGNAPPAGTQGLCRTARWDRLDLPATRPPTTKEEPKMPRGRADPKRKIDEAELGGELVMDEAGTLNSVRKTNAPKKAPSRGR